MTQNKIKWINEAKGDGDGVAYWVSQDQRFDIEPLYNHATRPHAYNLHDRVKKAKVHTFSVKSAKAAAAQILIKEARVTSPTCNGKGKQTIEVRHLGEPARSIEIGCITCNGKKTITQDQAAQEQRMRDAWCKCKVPGDPIYYHYANGAHGYDCAKCGKILQTG